MILNKNNSESIWFGLTLFYQNKAYYKKFKKLYLICPENHVVDIY